MCSFTCRLRRRCVGDESVDADLLWSLLFADMSIFGEAYVLLNLELMWEVMIVFSACQRSLPTHLLFRHKQLCNIGTFYQEF